MAIFHIRDLSEVYRDLKRISAGRMRGERSGHTLQTTALVHEALIRLVGPRWEDEFWESEAEFFAQFSETARRVLIDYSRRHKRQKRGGGWRRIPFNDAVGLALVAPGWLLEIDEAVDQLRTTDAWSEGVRERRWMVARMRIYGDVSFRLIAKRLGSTIATVRSDWLLVSKWLRVRLSRKA